jgi:hypothetical protein
MPKKLAFAATQAWVGSGFLSSLEIGDDLNPVLGRPKTGFRTQGFLIFEKTPV